MLVDMESHAVAELAWERKVPFLALRAVVDDAQTKLPGLVHGAINAKGQPRTALIALRLLLQPWTLNKLKELEAASSEAHKALARLSPLADVLLRSPF